LAAGLPSSAMELLAGALLGSVVTWAVGHFLPGAWRRLTGKPDLQVFVEDDLAVIWAGAPPWVGASYLVPNFPIEGSPPASCPDWHRWALGLGGVAGDSTHVEVTLMPGADLTVVVDAVRARVVSSRAQPRWTNLVCAVGGADITPRHMAVDLEAQPHPTSRGVGFEGEPFEWLSFSLAKGEVEKVHIIGSVRSRDIEWTAEILAIVNGKRRVFPINKNGKPFRTCSTRDLPSHMWVQAQSAWHPPLPSDQGDAG
jgi:hypothetical protein